MRQVRRKVNSAVREVGKTRDLVVTLDPATGLVGFRPAGLRRTEWLPANACWSLAVKLRLAMERKEKKKARQK